MPLSAGTRVGRYEILDRLGVGGMSEVYRARDLELGREVAVKALPEAWGEDRERVERFEREAQLLAALRHPNIAVIHGLEPLVGVMRKLVSLTVGSRRFDASRRGTLSRCHRPRGERDRPRRTQGQGLDHEIAQLSTHPHILPHHHCDENKRADQVNDSAEASDSGGIPVGI